jgi:hypothetical protein
MWSNASRSDGMANFGGKKARGGPADAKLTNAHAVAPMCCSQNVLPTERQAACGVPGTLKKKGSVPIPNYFAGAVEPEHGQTSCHQGVRSIEGGEDALPRKHPFSHHERHQLGRPVRLRYLGDGDAGYGAA